MPLVNEENFKCILDISDSEFLAKETVYKACCSACLLLEDDPDTCIVNVQRALEITLKYICTKFLGKTPYNLSELLSDNRLKTFIGNNSDGSVVTYLGLAGGAARKTGNKGKHENALGANKLEAGSNLSALAYVMPSLCDIISNGKPKKESKDKTGDDDKTTKIKGEINIRIGQHTTEGTDQLEVTLIDTNFDVKNSAVNKKIEYQWKFEKSSGNWIKRRIPYFNIGEKDYGRTITLRVRHDDYNEYLTKSFLIKKEDSHSKESLPKLKGEVVLEKKYDKDDGRPYLEALVHDTKTEEPLLYRWGFKQGDGTFFFNPPAGKPAKKDNNINWLKEDSNGNSNIGKRLVCRVTCDGYSKEGITSKYYRALEQDDFKCKIIGRLKINKDDETNSLIATLEDANIGLETPSFAWSIDGSDYSKPDTSPRCELTDESVGKVFICKSTCTPRYVGEVISNPYEVKSEELSDKPALDGSASITREKNKGKMTFRLNRENGDIEVEQLLYFWCVSNDSEKPNQDDYTIGGPFFDLEQEYVGKFIHGYISSKGYSGILEAFRGPIREEDLLQDINGSLKIKADYDENGKPFVKARFSKKNGDAVFSYNWSVDGEKLEGKTDTLYLSRDYINKTLRCTASSKDRNGEREAEYLVKDSLFPKEDITAVVSVNLCYEKDSDGKVSDACLEISVVECDIQNPIMTYDWFADNIPIADAHESKFIVSADKHINKTIRCDVHIEGCEEIFSAEHIVTEEELVISQPQTDPTPRPIEDPKPTPEPEPIPEPEPEAVISKHVLFEPAEGRDYKATRYFQSIRGQIQYFACNYDDSYVLNSYEKMDYSHFLYRFLKEQGFERVITVEKREGKFDLFAFDKLSELSFANPAEFRNVTRNDDADRLDKNSLKKFYDTIAEGRHTLTRPGRAALNRSSRSTESNQSLSTDITAEYGKRRINLPSITSKEIFQSTVSQYICPALKTSNAKTCVVLPIGLLVTNEYLTHEIASLIISAFNDAKKEVASNVLLITASRTEDFNAIMEQSYALFSELEPEINKAYVNAGNGERFGAVLVKRLIEESRILISEECPRSDEIANLFLKKTLIDKDSSFKELSFSKIYTLSDYIYKSEEFNSSVNEILGLPEGTNKLTIDFLESILTNNRIAETLVEKSKELKDRQPVKYNNLPSSYLSRVIGEVERSIISKAERDEELNSILLEMDELVGMEAVKIQVLEQMNSMESDLRRLHNGKIKVLPYQNMMFVGPPGTGKTTVAQLVARLMCAKGILPKETTVVRTPAHYNNTGTVGTLKDALQADIESAAGGVILFDEFYNFNQGHSAGNMANDALAAIMEGADRYKGRICIIIAGYEKQVMDTLSFNPGAERRFPSINKITFTSYSTPDIVEIFRRQVASSGFKEPDESVLRAIEPIIEAEKAEKRDEFANAGFVTDTLFPAIRRKYDSSKANNDIITVQHVIKAFPSFKKIIMNPGNAVDDILAEFDELVGMASVKEQIIEQMEVMKFNLREYRNGISSELPHQNMMFVGPQGTGKTTVATLVARLFAASGILPKRTPIIRTPKYYNNIGTVGVLGDALQRDIDSAEGGVILFDEFYNFNQGHSAGNMANDALAAIMDGADRYKGRICIIIAGYEKQVMDTLSFNPGAERRFPNKISFTPFSTADVVEIFRRYAISNNFKEPGKDVLDAIAVVVDNEKKSKGERFTNGGFVTDKLFEAVKRKYIMRKGTDYILTVGDVHEAFPNDSADQTVGQNKVYTRPSKDLFVNIEGDKFESTKDLKDFKKLSRNAILRINTSAGKVGTAFLIHPNGYAITCNHVIVDNNNIEAETITATLRFFSGNKSISKDVETAVLMRDPHLDMAILKLDPQNTCVKRMLKSMELEHLPYLRVTDERDELEDLTGEDSIICGFPNAKETAQARTIEISGMTKNPAKIDCYATSDNAYGGDSGAPIILADSRRVVGILKGSLKDKEGRGYEGDNFIIPMHYFWKDMVK